MALLDDPLFGPVVSVGADDPVASLLHDRAYRLAPVSVEGARDMLTSLGAVDLLTRGADDPDAALEGISAAVSRVSALHLLVPGVREVTVANLHVDRSGDLTAGGVTVVTGDTATGGDPTVRRL